jgi:hypothetical protein
MQQMSTCRRKARFEEFVEVVDLNGKQQLLPTTTCEVEEHHAFVALQFGSEDQRSVRISHRQFNSLIITRQVVYVSW